MDVANTTLKTRKRRRLRWMIGAGACAAAVLAVVLWRLGPALPTVQRASVWIDTVKHGPMLREVRATGTLVPLESRWLAAATPAQVEKILVWPGARVKPDTVLMRLGNPEVEDRLRNAQAQVAAARAQVAAKRAQLHSQLLDTRAQEADAQAAYASARVKAAADAKAIRQQLIPRVEYQQELIALKQLKYRVDIDTQRVVAFAGAMQAQLAAATADLNQQRSNLVLRQRQADALVVRAGISGVLLQQVPVQEGQQVAAGANLARVARPDVLIARLQVPEVQAKDVALGMPVTVDTYNGLVQGTVSRIDPAVTDGSVRVDVHLSSPLPPGARPDLSVDGRILVARLAHVLSVGRPAQAKAHGDISLFRLDPASGIATRVPVRIGAVSVDRVQVLHGLKAGDQVILSDTSQWDGYDRIRVE
ncbi:HlyD family efflux transporter periplasmic adaptor subunit [Oleiagrimonas sp. C23AA]|uniref:efflux RND transporter periplasmic adaptor subunit n=1 Tax=Oleiagrimonas sp. C23AA TaxID=2719047 RepID=UPI001423E529|nr:HlyD family efflux transporter periplasmic adaptor subunit [Oleiagrimonas sp. C23AA]NII09862.1 HlyD family efflux transporter periplasmic adaptor subunit [Oleiagrimonas sp. C23AA]